MLAVKFTYEEANALIDLLDRLLPMLNSHSTTTELAQIRHINNVFSKVQNALDTPPTETPA